MTQESMQSGEPSSVSANYSKVVDAVTAAAKVAGREAVDITLIAVSKTRVAEYILPVLAAGQIDFG